MDDEVVRTVESFAFKPICQRCFRAVFFNTVDSAVTMVANDQPAFAIRHESIGPRFFFAVLARKPTWVHEDGVSSFWAPLMNLVPGNIGKQQIPFVFDPNRSFGPLKSSCKNLDLC